MAETLSADAYNALVDAAATPRAALIVRLAAEAGLRTGELPRVRPCDLDAPAVDTAFGQLSIPSAAGDGIARVAPVPTSLVTALERYAAREGHAETDPFFPLSTRRLQMLVSETATRARRQLADPALEAVTPRTLRRTFAKRLLVDRGVDAHVVREAGGWETMAALDDLLEPLDGEAVTAALATDGVPLAGAFEAIADAPDREQLFQAVTTRLAAHDRWREARIVRRAANRRTARTVAVAGASAETRRSVVANGDAPWDDAVASAAVLSRTVDDERWVIAPIVHEEMSYGALCLVAATDAGVSHAESRALRALGRCLGWAVTAGRWRELLHSDGVIAVEFHTTATADFLAAVSATLECRIELDSTVAVSDTASRWFLSITGADPQSVADAIEATPEVTALRVVETRESGCTVSVRVTGGSIVSALAGRGATVSEATASSGTVRVVADVPEGTDVRPIADGLRRTYPDTKLTSKESVTRTTRSESALREDVAERLTDRQRAALSAAYHSGYFDWPRGSTAEEVADAMEVSSPTFHSHLRKAERALLDAIFDDDDLAGKTARERAHS